jgi:arylsulfatase A-like enzyme
MNVTAPRTPQFNLQSPEKVRWIGTNPYLEADVVDNIDQQARDRLRTLLSVDDWISATFDVLTKYNKLDSTYVIFMSDHGYHLGQWRVGLTKHLPYDTDIRIPFFMRGPDIKPNSFNARVVGNIDILPTLLTLGNMCVFLVPKPVKNENPVFVF